MKILDPAGEDEGQLAGIEGRQHRGPGQSQHFEVVFFVDRAQAGLQDGPSGLDRGVGGGDDHLQAV